MRGLLERPAVRGAASFFVLSLWLTLLLMGVAPALVVHSLLAVALALFPWRATMR